MKKTACAFLLFSFSLLCTSCFDIRENVLFNKNGSGEFTFSMNLAELKPMVSMFGAENGESSNELLASRFRETSSKLKQLPGITSAKSIEDTVNYTFGVSFSFDDIKALNLAMNSIFNDDSAIKQIPYFEWKGRQLIRNEQLDSKSILGKTTELSNTKGVKTQNSLGGLESLFSTVSYTTSYTFDRKVDSTRNENAMLSKDLKTVTVKCFPFALKDSTQKKCTVGNVISLH
jgi:hypothetical protein